MKIEMDKHGALVISAETQIEAYALKAYCEKNISAPEYDREKDREVSTLDTAFLVIRMDVK